MAERATDDFSKRAIFWFRSNPDSELPQSSDRMDATEKTSHESHRQKFALPSECLTDSGESGSDYKSGDPFSAKHDKRQGERSRRGGRPKEPIRPRLLLPAG